MKASICVKQFVYDVIRVRQWRLNSSLTRIGLVRIAVVAAVVAAVAAAPLTIEAAPFNRDFTFPQPNGESIVLHGQGDEFSAIFETLDGYTVAFDHASGLYHYAAVGADGRLAASGIVAGTGDPAAVGIKTHLRPATAVTRSDRRERLQVWEKETGIRERWESLKSQHRAVEAVRISENSSILMAPPSQTTTGNRVGLTLIVDFSDANGTIAKSDVQSFLNSDNYTGFGNNGSVKAYFHDNSAGLLTYTNVVVGYIRLPHAKTYHDDPNSLIPQKAQELVQDAIAVMKGWGNYNSEIRPQLETLTVDGNNSVVACNIYYAGECSSPWSYGLWPHSGNLFSPLELWSGGRQISRYQMTDMTSSLAIGTFCHENGHMLCGFPDLYDYDYDPVNGYDSIGGAGDFCLMGYGNYGTDPVQICAYLKLAAGWASTVTDMTFTGQTYSLPRAGGDSGNVFLCLANPAAPDTEYFLVENRQATERDYFLPASGVAVWHIDELGNRDDQRTAWNSSHQNYECSLEQADNWYDLQNNVNYGDWQDLFYLGNDAGGYANAFDDNTEPSARWWNGNASGLRFNGFSASGDTMTIGTSQVDHFAFATISSPESKNGAFSVTVTAKNSWDATATDFNSTATLLGRIASSSEVVIGNWTDYYGLPMYTYYHDARQQVIYLQSEIGTAKKIVSLSLDVALAPGQTMNNWTIRMKHTSLSSYASASWESSGWTIVYQNNEDIQSTGWVKFDFQTPFNYNGTDNLMIDFSFNNSSYSYEGYCRYTATPTNRTVCGFSDSENGDPLNWSGASNPTAYLDSSAPDIVLGGPYKVRITPTSTVEFVSGVWTGNVTVTEEVNDMLLRVSDGMGHTGDSSAFNVVVDGVAPFVSSIVRAGSNPTTASSVNYTVTFSESVTGVDNADFSLTLTGVSGASVSGVSGSGATRTVSVATGSGEGTIRLDLTANSTITDAALNSLAANYTSGQTYTITHLNASEVWVDFNNSGFAAGSQAYPFATFGKAVSKVASGQVIKVKGDTATKHSAETIRVTKAANVQAVGGAVTVGR